MHSRSKGEQAQLCTGEGLTCQAQSKAGLQGSGTHTAPYADAQTNMEELQPLHLPYSQGTAVPGWGQGAALLHTALPYSHFPPLQLCWQQLSLC